jgi:transcriptional regulator with XRE-family HTH domain
MTYEGVNKLSLNKKVCVMLLQKGKSQQEIAELVGTSQPHVSNWLNGYRFPNSHNLNKLANVLEITPEELASKLIEISNLA